MPFTFAHPSIILPLTSNKLFKLSTTGLVVGSLVPDFEYFIRMKVQSIYSHSFLGLFWFDLPLGVFLCFIYHFIVRNALINNLPSFYYNRICVFKAFNWRSYFQNYWLFVFISILLGAASHLVWDSFTHTNGYFVKEFSFLNQLTSLGNSSFPLYKLLQHLSSVFGILVILLYLNNLKPEKTIRKNKIFHYWISVSAIGILVILINFNLGLQLNAYGNIIVTLISGFIIGLICTPTIIGVYNSR